MKKKKSVLFYLDNYTPAMKGLSFEQKGMLFDAIISYAGGLADTPEDLGMLSLALDPIKAAIDRDNIKYVQICERNQKNGKKGGKPKQTHPNPKEPTGLFTTPNKPDSDKDNDTDTIQIQIKKEQEPSAPPVTDEKFYTTKKKKKLSGKRLETFERFWNAFDYKKSKSEAADSWLEIPELKNGLVDIICDAAEKEASMRPGILSSGKTPKMAQGWLSSRRWEDEHCDSQPVKYQPQQFLSPAQRREENNRLAGEAFLDGFHEL